MTSVQKIVSRDRETNRTDLIENKCGKPILINYGFRKTKCVRNLSKIHFLAIIFNIFFIDYSMLKTSFISLLLRNEKLTYEKNIELL